MCAPPGQPPSITASGIVYPINTCPSPPPSPAPAALLAAPDARAVRSARRALGAIAVVVGAASAALVAKPAWRARLLRGNNAFWPMLG